MLGSFVKEKRMKVNANKTKMMVFNGLEIEEIGV